MRRWPRTVAGGSVLDVHFGLNVHGPQTDQALLVSHLIRSN